MNRLFIIGLVAAAFLLSGCAQPTQYVCADNTVVDDPAKCAEGDGAGNGAGGGATGPTTTPGYEINSRLISHDGTVLNDFEAEIREYEVKPRDFGSSKWFPDEERLILLDALVSNRSREKINDLRYTFYCESETGRLETGGATHRGFKLIGDRLTCMNEDGDSHWSVTCCTLNEVRETSTPPDSRTNQPYVNTVYTIGNGANLKGFYEPGRVGQTNFFVHLVDVDGQYPTDFTCHLKLDSENIHEVRSVKLQMRE